MQHIVKQMKIRKSILDESDLCKFMNNHLIPANERVVFTPTMLFFVLSFKDALQYLKIEDDQNELQQMVNQHCYEDSEHWEWYLNDLQRFLQKGVLTPQLLLAADPRFVWSDCHWNVRNNTYRILYECREAKYAFHRLLVLQVLEAAFDSFCVGMKKTIQQVGLFEDLEYFGMKHVQAEEGHSFDDWLYTDEEKLIKQYGNISQQELVEGLKIVDRLFDTFEEMFCTWYNLGKVQLKNTQKNKQLFQFQNVPKQSQKTAIITNKVASDYSKRFYTAKKLKCLQVKKPLVWKESKKFTKNFNAQQKFVLQNFF